MSKSSCVKESLLVMDETDKALLRECLLGTRSQILSGPYANSSTKTACRFTVSLIDRLLKKLEIHDV